MTALTWDGVGERLYETGVDHGVLYIPTDGVYSNGYAWNGLTTVTESPTGAEPTALYADNIKYLSLLSLEEFAGTIEAYTYPDEFGQCDGTASPEDGILIGQQSRKTFGLAYRTLVGNDVENTDLGYKLHLVWGALAAPSEKAYTTVNDSPEAITFSWEFTTSPIAVTGYKPTASMVIDSTKVSPTALANLETALYGSVGVDPRLPTPNEVLTMFAGSVTEAVPVAPSYIPETEGVVIPTVTGITYKNGSTTVTGTIVITGPTVIKAHPNAGYKLPAITVDEWYFTTTTLVTPGTPTYDSGTDNITIPSTTGVIYKIAGSVVTGTVNISANTTVTAHPAAGYAFPTTAIDVWFFTFA